jgi:PAS domain S-box-containing protein
MTDITADHLYRQEITDRERLLSAVLETAPDAFAITDSHGVVTAWNPAAETMFGWSADEAIGKRLENLIIPAHLADAHTQGLARRAATGQVRLSSDVVQVPAVRRDGSDLQVELSLGSFGWHGERRFHAFLRDVTEREHARQRLAQANSDLAQANEELDRFTAMVAHDLKSPLTAIAGYTEVLEDTASANRGHQEQAALSAITRATTRMRVMIDDLLDYARAANEPLTLRPVDLNPVIDELAAEIRASATRPVRITREQLPTVEAHPTLLRQVLANLLGNAAKYVSPDTTPQVHIGAQTNDSTVTIVVTDNGIGISPQARERVFTMFHRENTRGFPGNGIGLATCRRIMNRHHGRIWIDRSTERGTTVKLALPRTQPPDRPDDTEHGAARG